MAAAAAAGSRLSKEISLPAGASSKSSDALGGVLSFLVNIEHGRVRVPPSAICHLRDS